MATSNERVNSLFEELLGENASAIGSTANKKEDATQMSSVIPTRRDLPNKEDITDSNDKQQPQEVVSNDNATINDEDTYMTKPRVIAVDSNDDVSTLFGGMGGASLSGNGVESYQGFVSQRRNRRSNGVGGALGVGLFGSKKKRNRRSDENSHNDMRTGATSTFQSHGGVTTILEEIGIGGKSKASTSECAGDDDEKGNAGRRHYGRRGSHYKHPSGRKMTFGEQIAAIKPKTWAILFIGISFLSIQFRAVHKQNKASSGHLTSRFSNRYDTAKDSHKGMSTGMKDFVTNSVVEGDGRRRNNYETADGVNKFQQEQQLRIDWERGSSVFNDDGLLAGLKKLPNNLRGNPPQQSLYSQLDHRQVSNLQQQPPQRSVGEVNSRNQQVDAMQNRQQQVQQQPQLPSQILGKSMNDAIQQQPGQQQLPRPRPPMNEDLGDEHPLLKKSKQLSNGGDKLADYNPVLPQSEYANDIIPKRFHTFADIKQPFIPGQDTPFYWHIPRAGGVVMKTLLSHCLGQTLAAEVGELEGHDQDTELKVVRLFDHNYTNVNVATPEGIMRALDKGLVPSHLADTIVSGHVDLITSLFNGNDRARAFVMFRQPIDRAVSIFHFLKGTGYPPLQNMTLDDYAKSTLIENNWMTRILTESMTGPIDMETLDIAKEVLRRKFLIGLLDNKRGSFARFDHYFKWKDSPRYEKEFGCRKQLMDEKYMAKHPLRKNSDTWKLVMEQNRFDIHLYDYAKELFASQSFIFGL
mmetsp:Transcript_670/g.1548  ORF Transcript_670/g.1548 Transcript_670/m.1548 type:complete len:749 (-) Transcript_670:21-2267(-)